MAAHSYWRVHITTNNGASRTSIGQLEMASEDGGTNLCTGGTIIFDAENGSYPATNAFNGNNANLWANATANPHWLGYQFAAPVDIKEVRMWNPASTECPKNYTIEHSDDGITWTLAEAYTEYQATSATAAKVHTIYDRTSQSGSHSHWRLFIETNDGHPNYIAMAELEMSEFGGASLTTGGTATSSSVLSASYHPDNAFDGIVVNSTDQWVSTAGEITNQWVAYEFTAPVDINVIKIYASNAALVGAASDINTFRVEYSDDGETWHLKWRVLYQTSWGDLEERTFITPWVNPITPNTAMVNHWLKLNTATPSALPYTFNITKDWITDHWVDGGEDAFGGNGFGFFKILYAGKTYDITMNGNGADGVISNTTVMADDSIVFDVRYGWFITGMFFVEVIPSSSTVPFQLQAGGQVGSTTVSTHALTTGIGSLVPSPRIDNYSAFLHASFSSDQPINSFNGADPQIFYSMVPMHQDDWQSPDTPYTFNEMGELDITLTTDIIQVESNVIKAGVTFTMMWTNDSTATSDSLIQWLYSNLFVDEVSRYQITGKVTHGNNAPTERAVYLHNAITGELLSSGYSNKFSGEFTLITPDGSPSYIRVVDESGVYNTEVRDNITPIIHIPI